MLLNNAKCQDYNFYRFWVKGKPIGKGGGISTTPPPIPPRPNTLIKAEALLDYIRLFIFSKKVYDNNIKLNLTNN